MLNDYGEDGMLLNADLSWDDFDPKDYHSRNYLNLREDDRQIIGLVRDFFCAASITEPMNGVDVGTGTNLYPAFSMLPFCSEIALWEYSQSNIEWLQREVNSFDPSWMPFWDELRQAAVYRQIEDPRTCLAERARVVKGNVFDLPAETWHIGTMFFVAESISASRREFESSILCFARALKPGSPFAIGCIENSAGHYVREQPFPAVAITETDIAGCLNPLAEELQIDRLDICGAPLRDGYTGMVIARGRVRSRLTFG